MVLLGCNRDGPLLIETSIDQTTQAIDTITPKYMAKYGITGLSIGVIKEGRLSLERSFGFSNTATATKIDKQTVFRAASLGKPIFAYIVVSLVRQGLLQLDTPLYSYLGEQVIKDDQHALEITARMVLSHTTGLPNLNTKPSDYRFHFSPGSDFKYSGHGYLYLQKVVEKLSGKSLQQLAQKLVFKPLGMTQSSYIWQPQFSDTLASSHDSDGKAYPTKRMPESGFSAWSLFTTLEDYSKFVTHMLNTAETNGTIAAELVTPQIKVADDVRWGLGWGLQDTKPNRSFWHWGSMNGFKHFVVGYPNEKIAVIVLTNHQRAFKIVDEIMAAAIGGSYPAYDWF
jgi:CubicO group peptidase (beta-lactamase class C family)